MNNISTTTEDENAQLQVAETLKQENKYKDAINLIEQVILNNPFCSQAYEHLADNFISTKKFDKAEKALLHAITIDKNSVNAFYLLGFINSLQEKWEESKKYLKKANTLRPHHPEILRCLGWAIFHGNQNKLGLSILERAHNLNPLDINISCDLGICYIHSHNLDKATYFIEKARKTDPKSEQVQKCASILSSMKGNNIGKK